MNQITTTKQPGALALAGQLANEIAAQNVFADFRKPKAQNTLIRHDCDLAVFSQYLVSIGLHAGDFLTPDGWQGVTWGIVQGFVNWQLQNGYAVSSVNVRLSTVKTYSKLALKAGSLAHGEYALIRAVDGYSRAEGKRIDEKRAIEDLDTRKGTKKAESVFLTPDQVKALKMRPDTPQGRRDALLMALMLDHGLRVGEVAILTVTDFDLKAGELRFYRPKVNKAQVHKLSKDALQAARRYFKHDAPAVGKIFRASRKDGSLRQSGLSERAITKRVHDLGAQAGIAGLSAHDLRHTWATRAARNGTPLDRLQDAGGWNSHAMPLRYIEAAIIANQGVELGE